MAKKKVLLLSSYGGNGHIAAANTLQKLLGDRYEFHVSYPLTELQILRIKKAENIYNVLLANNMNRAVNGLVRLVTKPLFKLVHQRLIRLLSKRVSDFEPELILSLIPFANHAASIVANRFHLPYLIVTTDNDLCNWVAEFEKRQSENFRVTIGADLPTTMGRLSEKGVRKEQIDCIGLPLPPEFTESLSKEKLRRQYGIAPEKNVVLIMMGGAGSKNALRYAKRLLQEPMDLHLIVFLGKNVKKTASFKALSSANGNTLQLVPFTDKVHEFFAISDLLITKPGPGTINEAIAQKLPMLVDQTSTFLFWERANVDLVLNYQVGACISSDRDIVKLVHQFLYDEQTIEEVFRAFERIPRNCFAEKIEPIIESLIGVGAKEKETQIQ